MKIEITINEKTISLSLPNMDERELTDINISINNNDHVCSHSHENYMELINSVPCCFTDEDIWFLDDLYDEDVEEVEDDTLSLDEECGDEWGRNTKNK